MRKLGIIMGIVALSLVISGFLNGAHAWCGGFEAPMTQHYAYWGSDDGTAVSRYGECWITIEDESYHHDVSQALACGDAVKRTATFEANIHANFDFDQHAIRPDDFRSIMATLDGVVSVDGRVNAARLTGHTDSYGTDVYNLALGHRRASHIGALLLAGTDVLGMPTPEISYVSNGETTPVAPNTTPGNRFLNRRVEGVLEIEIDFIEYQ